MARLKETEAVKAFVGYGSGYGDGSGGGDGYGCGYGSDDGYGSGSGYGYGSPCAIGGINGHKVYDIDGVATVIQRVRGNVAKGAILQSDLTLSPCYVVKQDGLFAHGESLGEAMEALRDKMFKDMPQEERIEAFIKEHELGTKYENGDFFSWHRYLTGSCEAGRRAFVRDRGIDLSGSMTVEEFIALTKGAYGGEVIKELARRYGIEEEETCP